MKFLCKEKVLKVKYWIFSPFHPQGRQFFFYFAFVWISTCDSYQCELKTSSWHTQVINKQCKCEIMEANNAITSYQISMIMSMTSALSFHWKAFFIHEYVLEVCFTTSCYHRSTNTKKILFLQNPIRVHWAVCNKNIEVNVSKMF